MLEQSLIISLLNLGIYILLSEGYLLHKVNIALSNFADRVFGLKAAAVILEPVMLCYVCMSSVWTIAWTLVIGYSFSFCIIIRMLLVCAISYVIERILTRIIE